MKIISVVDPSHAHALVQQRTVSPPALVPIRRVAAVNRPPGEERAGANATPDDGISLALSPEAREAARQAALAAALEGQQDDQANESAGQPDTSDEGHSESGPEQQVVEQLRERDKEVRAHEQAHAAAAGSMAHGDAVYSYQIGPDGHLYAISGKLDVDVSDVPGDPEATLRKAEQIQQAALAPGDPSPADRAVAAMAAAMAARARQELARQQQLESKDGKN